MELGKYARQIRRDKAENLFLNHGWKLMDIAREINVDLSTVRKYLKERIKH